MLIVKIGGPAYRIGMGGGAASSVPSGSLSADLDFNAVQRGDAEMSQKLWRVVRACVELGKNNPIESLHDQGAGGNCNVVKEIIYPLGAGVFFGWRRFCGLWRMGWENGEMIKDGRVYKCVLPTMPPNPPPPHLHNNRD